MRTPLLLITLSVSILSNAQVTVPYSTGFEGQVGNLAPWFPEGWTWEDLNTEPFGNQGWQIIKNTDSQQNAHTDSTAAHMFSHSSETNNDWLFTPGMQLQGGVTYTISFWYSVASLFASTERLALRKGNSPTSLAMNETLWANDVIENQEYQQASINYTPGTDGLIYFSFHYYSEEFQFILLLDDVSITGSPAGVEEVNREGLHLWLQDDMLTLKLPGYTGSATLAILDAAGRTVLAERLSGVISLVGVGGLPEGSYLARTTASSGRSSTKRFAILR